MIRVNVSVMGVNIDVVRMGMGASVNVVRADGDMMRAGIGIIGAGIVILVVVIVGPRVGSRR